MSAAIKLLLPVLMCIMGGNPALGSVPRSLDSGLLRETNEAEAADIAFLRDIMESASSHTEHEERRRHLYEAGIELDAEGATAIMPSGRRLDTGSQIDFMILYTPAVLAMKGSDAAMRTNIQQGLDWMNQALVNTKLTTPLTINLVYSGLTNLVEPTSGDIVGAGFDYLASQPSSVIYLREKYGADMVQILVSSGGGLGIVGAYPMVDTSGADGAISSVGVDLEVRGRAHEFGHNMGSNHNHELDPTGTGDNYAYNLCIPGGSSFNTIMGYGCDTGGGFPTSTDYSEAQLYSSPTAMVNGVPAGRLNYANNARVFSANKYFLANYRPSGGVKTTPWVGGQSSGPADYSMLSSPDLLTRLLYQTDGNLVLYQTQAPSGMHVQFASNTYMVKSDKLILQANCELQILDSRTTPPTAVWTSGVLSNSAVPKCSLVVLNEGVAAIYDGSTAIWSTGPLPLPTPSPTPKPVVSTGKPTTGKPVSPTGTPTRSPTTKQPTSKPTVKTSAQPTQKATTGKPSPKPTAKPSAPGATAAPSRKPTSAPTKTPTAATAAPTASGSGCIPLYGQCGGLNGGFDTTLPVKPRCCVAGAKCITYSPDYYWQCVPV